jgi:hypothetical protein
MSIREKNAWQMTITIRRDSKPIEKLADAL